MNEIKGICDPIEADDLVKYVMRKATKTKSIKAKHISSLVVDNSIMSKLILDTLEGTQPIRSDCMICLGEAGDIWPQLPDKLFKKYTVSDATQDGWLICKPKPDNVVLAGQFSMPAHTNLRVKAQWGSPILGTPVDGKFMQTGNNGDYICQSVTDPSDIWIVNRSLFESTYSFIEE